MLSENRPQILDVNEHKHGQAKILTQQGDVTEQMDKTIGRSVFRIRGAVSANNYVEFEHLSLVGSIVYVQMCLQNPVIATFHLEIVTSANVSLRLSVSTLYHGDAPKFLGRSLRLPLPHLSGWMVIKLDLNEIIARYCSSGSKAPATLQSIKKIQMCSSMLFRDVVTSDKHIPFDVRLLPKELAIKPQSGSDSELQWMDMIEHCANLPAAGASNGNNLKSPELNSKSAKTSRVQKTLLLAQDSPPPAVNLAFGQKVAPASDAVKSAKPVGLAIKTNFTAESAVAAAPVESTAVPAANTALLTMEDLNESVIAHSPARHSLKAETAMMARKAKGKVGAGKESIGESTLGLNVSVPSAYSPTKRGSSHPIGSPSAADKETVLSQALSTPRHTLKSTNNAFTTPSAAGSGHIHGATTTTLGSAGIVRYSVPDVAPSDRLLSLERLLGYNGGPSVLLYEGRMLLLGTHSLLVMVDLQSDSCLTSPTHSGLWKAFRNASSTTALGSTGGFRQAILRGHSAPITMIELSEKENLMATAEAVGAEGGAGLLILWDLVEGKKLASLKPHSDTILCAGFSPDCAMLVTCGTDEQHRYQIIVWDLQTTLTEKSVVVGSQASSASFTIARQISEFPIYRIKFSPYEEYSLVSCGRENIRFWRIRKGHLPGRPVVLNEYSRGYSFTELAFSTEGGATLKEGKKHVVYVASNKGLLLRINCQNNQILAAFQLHPSAILSLCVHSGYAATGGEDCRLRVWPLDFSDFLLEAQHEGAVTSIRVSTDGRKLAIGTSTGTLGVLNVSEHSYNTVLRSHIGAITHAVKRGPLYHEFATIGRDFTIRVWDVLTATQIIEFSSERDEPLCLSYHPTDHYLACGFRSGFVRVFDVTTAGLLHEHKSHAGAVSGLTFVTPPGGLLVLVSAGSDGNLVVHSEVEHYNAVRTVSFANSVAATEKIHLVLDESQGLLAVATATIASIVVFETKDFSTLVKLLPTIQSPAAAPGPSSVSPMAASGTASSVQPAMTAQAVFSQLMGGTNASGRIPATPTAAGGSATTSNTSGDTSDSLSGVVVGLFFLSDESGASLLITTDKHLISIPMHNKLDGRSSSRRVNKRITAWDERSTRRMDFGVPTTVRKDDASGLVFMTVRAPIAAPKKAATNKSSATSKAALNKLAPEANAFVVLEVRMLQGYSESKVLVSPVQVYQELPGVVLDICPYFEFNRVVSVDVNGCIGFWEVKDHNLANVKIPEGNFKSSLLLSSKVTSAETPLIKSDGAGDAATEALTRDFEAAVKVDPAMWSAASDSRAQKTASADSENEETEEPEAESAPEPTAPSTVESMPKESFESILARAVQYTNMPDIPLHNRSPQSSANGSSAGVGAKTAAYFDLMYDDDEAADELALSSSADALLQQFDDSVEPTPEKLPAPVAASTVAPTLISSEEPVIASQKALHRPRPSAVDTSASSVNGGRTSSDALFDKKKNSGPGVSSAADAAFADFSLDGVSTLSGPSVLVKLLPKFKSGGSGGLLSSPQYDSLIGSSLSLRNAVPPCFNADEGVVVVSDGSMIVVKYLNASESVLLKFPEYLHQFRSCSVVSVSLSHSGVVVAAVIRVVSNTDHSVAHCLVVWCSAAAGEWKVAGMADLNITESQQQIDFSALNKVLVTWSDNDSLVVVSTVRSNVEVKSFAREQVRVTTAPMSAILSGGLKDAVKACTCVVNVPTCYVISNCKLFPSRGATDRHLSVIVTSQHKAFLLHLSNVNSSSLIAEVLWSDDIGNKGPYLSLDIIRTHGEHSSTPNTAARKDSRSSVSRLMVGLLDSFGAVKFVEFFNDEPSLTSRSVTVSIPASNISGALHSMALLPQASSSNLLVALGAAHNVRVFSVQFKDVNVKTLSANMVLNYKVAVDFSADFFFALPVHHGHTNSAIASSSPSLLTFSASGHFGVVSGGSSAKEHLCYTLQSAGPSTADAITAASVQATHPLLSLVTHKGHVSLIHASTGIRLSTTNKVAAVGRVLCVEPVMSGGHIVVGAVSGRVALLDALTLEMLETWPLQGATAVRSSISSSTASFHKKLPGVSTSTDFDFKFHKHQGHGAVSVEAEDCAVVKLNSLAGGMALTALQRNNTVSIVQLYPNGKADVATVAPAFEHSGPNLITDRLLHREQTQTLLASCAGDAQMCGVLRAGTNILELHRTDHNESGTSPVQSGYKKKSYWTNVLNLSLKTVGPEGPGTLREQRAGTHDVNIELSSVHVQFSGRELVIYAVGRDVSHNQSSSSSSVYCGAVSMPESASSTFTKDSPTRVVLRRQMTFSESVESHHFSGSVLAVALSSTVLAFELKHCGDSANGEQKMLREVLSVPASSVALGSNWQQTTVIVSGGTIGNTQEVVVSRQHPLPAVLKFHIAL